MGRFGPTLMAYAECTLPGGRVKVVGHGRHLLVRHLDVEVTADVEAEVRRWHDKDIVVIGTAVYLVNFIDFEDFSDGVRVAHLVLVGEQDDPDFKRAMARASRAVMGR